jgi:hypothetical protein
MFVGVFNVVERVEHLVASTLGPNLHRRTESHRSHPPPRVRRPPEAKGNDGLAGGSTNRLSVASLNCSRGVRESRERGFRRSAIPGWIRIPIRISFFSRSFFILAKLGIIFCIKNLYSCLGIMLVKIHKK